MKKARNLWRDLPQGGSRYGSVLTRLFLLLCLLATTQAGWADATSAINLGYSVTSGNSDRWKNSSNNNVTGETQISSESIFTRSYTESGQTFSLSLTISSGKIKSTEINMTKPSSGTNTTSLTITAPTGYSMTQIVVGGVENLTSLTTSVNNTTGTPINTTDKTATWTGNASNSVTLNFNKENSGSNAKVQNVTITYAATSGGGSTHTISYNAGGGSGTMSSNTGIADGGEQTLTANTFTKDGYTFANWTANVDVTANGSAVAAGSAIADEATLTNITSDISLTAQWTAITLTEIPQGTTVSLVRTGNSDQQVPKGTIIDSYVEMCSSNTSTNNSTKRTSSGLQLGDNKDYLHIKVPANSQVRVNAKGSGSGNYMYIGTDATATANTNVTSNFTDYVTTFASASDVYIKRNSTTLTIASVKVEAAVPTIAFNNPKTSITVGGSTVTNTATKTNAGDAAITYSSSDTSVATVDANTGEVTAVSAGNTVITASMTVDETEYTASYNMTVKAASVASTKWDFTTLSSDEIDDMRANTNQLAEVTSSQYFKNQSWSNPYNFKDKDGNDLNVTDGLLFGGGTSNNKYQYYYGDDKRIRIVSSNYYVQLPTQQAGTEIKITWKAISSGRTLTADNATVEGSSNKSAQLSSGTKDTSTFIVDADGTVKFTASGTLELYKIEVGSAVAAPTVTPVTDANFSTSPKSVTFTTNETGGETYYVVGATRETNAATIANGTLANEGANNVDVSTFVTNESNAVISAVTKKGNEYSNIVYVDLTYNGTITAQIGNDDNVDIQQGNYATITPIITDASGNQLKFDQDEDATVDYSQYYDFAFAVKQGTTPSQYCSLDATTGKVNTRETISGVDYKAAVDATITVTVTATPKQSPAVTLNYVKAGTLTKDITFTVIAEDQTVTTQWVDFYWDEACTIPISENHGGVTGQAKSQSMTFTNFPNGKVIYAKVNKEYADMICFYYNNKDTSKPTAEVSKVNGMTSISNNNGKKYRYRQCLPIYKDADGAGTDGDKVWVTLGGYKEDADATVGKFINMEFTLKANSSRPAAPTYTPETTTSSDSGTKTKMTTAKASTANGDPNGTVMAKYSTNNSYTIIELVSLPSDDNPRTLNVGKGSVGVFSTVPTSGTKTRKTTGVQVLNGVISPISNAYYTYYPAQNEVTLKFDPEEVTVHTTGADAKVFTKPTLNITAKDVSHITPITYSIESGGDGRISAIDASTGDITFVEGEPTPGVVVIKARYEGEAYGDDTYAPAEATYTIYMVDPSKEVVLIKPGSRTFTTEQEVVIEGANTWTGYYKTSDTADDVEFDAATWNVIEPGTTTTLHVTETTTVQAMVVDPSDQTAKNRTKQTYTKKTVAPPTLYPDGVTSTYYFTTGELKDGKLAIVAATTEPMANVYYVVDDDPSVLTNGGGTRYIGTDKIQIDGSKTTTYVYAVTQDAEGNRSAVVRGVYTKSSDVKQPAFKVNESGTEFASGETKTIAASDKVYIIDKSNETGAVTYFTMDGSSPTTSSQTYTGAFHINKSGTVVKAITVHGEDVSPISTATFNLAASDENRFWEANSETCDKNGKLVENDGKSGAVISVAKGSPKAVNYITATFGGIYKDSKDVWKHEKIGEESKGEPLDGVGTYQISTGYDAMDETCILQGSESAMYNHANSATSKAVHERTFTLPARGAYVKFEPEKDGDLTIWALQNGGVYYNESSDGKENFLSGFIRKRPVYMVDEQGNCLAATEVKAAGTLSDNWSNINRDDLIEKDGEQGGITQKLFTKAEAEKIYDMYSAKIADAPNTDMNNLIVYLNDGTHTDAANAGIEGGDASTGTNIGVCIPSASYMRYTYKVRAGKTYFFFASRTKLGIRGFRFDPNTEGLPAPDTSTGITTTETGTTNSTAINTAAVKDEGKTVTRKFTTGRTLTAGKWYGLVLPFSISESKLKDMFDDGSNTMSILHFRTVEGSKIYLRKHYHQMIVAGTPVLIYVSKTGTLDFDEVQVEAASPVAITSNGYSFTGTFDQITLPRYAYYINTSGGFSQWTSENNTNLKSMRSYMTSPTQGARKLTFAANNYDDEDDEQIVTGIEYLFYDDDATTHFGNSDVYNLNGQIVRKNATSLIGLPKGIYIVNGKKVAVK